MNDRDDQGLTLVELIVYIAVSALFLSLLAGLLIAGWNSQLQTSARDRATGDANAIAELLTASVRNATAIAGDDEQDLLVATVLTSADGYVCRGWQITDRGDLQYAEWTAPAATESPLPFSAVTKTVIASSVDGSFAVAGTQLTASLEFTREGETARFDNSVNAQARAPKEYGPCR